jgi:hypothetical protein
VPYEPIGSRQPLPREAGSNAQYLIDAQLGRLYQYVQRDKIIEAVGLPTDPSAGSILYVNSSGEYVELAAPGSTPKYLGFDTGATVPSWLTISASTPDVLVVERTLTSAEINSGNTSPVTIQAAAGANTILVPIRVQYFANRTASAFSVDPSFRLRYTGSTTDLFTAVSFFLTTAAAGTSTRSLNPAEVNYGYGGFDPRNVGIQVSTSADSTGGTGTVRVCLTYAVVATA